jgi:hypothetical protein
MQGTELRKPLLHEGSSAQQGLSHGRAPVKHEDALQSLDFDEPVNKGARASALCLRVAPLCLAARQRCER